ncbi:aldo/keto reductase [Microbacterium atlanticum]|uniref:aldo/keto reductase n=1 Tax=Microbacterium atlanticum TaxID=2782168 RepID=UPI00188966CE|nr:aldo/keto reductase [Microbacterium atlanticum]
MKYVKLGSSGVEVSPIAVGGLTFGQPDRGHPRWSLDEDEARPLIRRAIEAGVNFFDTANMYSNGSSEEILGRALRDFGIRDELVIATKVLHPMRSGPNAEGLSRKSIMAEIDHSLRRLGTDHVDIYQIHRIDRATPWEETLEALHDIVKAGKVRYLGASSMRAWEFAKALRLQRENGWARFVSMQDHYNLLQREEEREMIPLCLDEGVGTLAWSPLARGRLARPWGEKKSTERGASDEYADILYGSRTDDSDSAIIDAVGRVADGRGIPRAQVALAWLHAQPVVTAPITGVSRLSQLDDAIASIDVILTADEIRELEADYTPRHDFQAADEKELMASLPQFRLAPH